MRREGEEVLREASVLFANRQEAGAFLAHHLGGYAGKDPLILGIARGGMVVAAEIACRLGGELDVVVARKLGAPGHSELAIGAVTADGGRYLNQDLIVRLGVSSSYLHAETEAQMKAALSRERRYREGRIATPHENRILILVDDGLATGSTMLAVVRSVRQHQPARLIVAVPVGSREACRMLQAEADEIVCPYVPLFFQGVGQFYERFGPVQDDEVCWLLREHEPVEHTIH